MKKERVSYSAWCALDKSPNHLLAYWDRKIESTPAQIQGKLIHKLLLERDKVEEEFRVYGKTRRGQEWLAFKEENKDYQIITSKEFEAANIVYNKVKDNKWLVDILMRTGEVEKHIEWERNNQKFHGYVDIVGDDFICDIKTCVDAGDRFARDFEYNNYKMQGAMYLDAFDNIKKYKILAIEKSEPYNVQLYTISEETLFKGEIKYLHLIDKYKSWDGKNQSYSKEPIEL